MLASCGTAIHAAAVKKVFHTITITDEEDALVVEHKSSWIERPVLAVLRNPGRYAAAVKKVEVEDIPTMSSMKKKTT